MLDSVYHNRDIYFYANNLQSLLRYHHPPVLHTARLSCVAQRKEGKK